MAAVVGELSIARGITNMIPEGPSLAIRLDRSDSSHLNFFYLWDYQIKDE